MSYIAVVKALYDYAAQDPETELSLVEDQICYVIEKEDDDWWKAKAKDTDGQEGPIGLIPVTYVEELPPLNTTRSLYAYDSTSPEELTIEESAVLHVFSIEDDWLLVRPESSPDSPLGFVPRNYCDPLDDDNAVVVPDANEAEAEVQAHQQEEAEIAAQRQHAEQQRQMKLKDKVETFGVSELDGKTKKKGTLGVGNGAVFFASDTDKMSGVVQHEITELVQVSQPSSKVLQLEFTSSTLILHCGATTDAIIAKLESSKVAAGESLELTRVTSASSEEPEPKTVRWAADGGDKATVLYDFDAQGDDELSVREGEIVTVIDKENDEWWTITSSSGAQGVVPAQYVQLDGETQEDTEASVAAVEAERQREAAQKAEERRAIERAARERQRQEEEDRKYAEHLEQREAAKAERRARRQQEEQRSQREIELAKRREEARGHSPPRIAKRPSAQDVHQAARNLPARGKQAPARPPEQSRPKPTPGRTRVWSDKTGQFKVEAEYLGLNGNKIRLHKLNGVIIEVPMEKMSTEDVQLIRRHEARKARAALDDDNTPLGAKRPESRSEESRSRAEPTFEPIPKEAMQPQKSRKPRFDWFGFFLEAGCDMDDCTRYSAAFERDRIDEELLPELDAATIRGLGLKEGDVIRVRKVITSRYAQKTPEQLAQIKQDEDYARELQEHENSGAKGPIPQPPPSLFTSANGKLANNTRRGRPEKKATGPDSVDPTAIVALSEQLTGATVSPPQAAPVQPAAPAPPTKLLSGFDDDAWTIKPSASKPASPAPPPPAPPALPAAPTPPPSNPTESLLAQIQAMRPASTGVPSNPTGVSSNATGGSSNFDKYAAMVAPVQPASASPYGLGMQNSNQPMSQLQAGPRGPLAPVASNEPLLNPLQPAQTGFVPTRQVPQATGFQSVMMQPTGYAGGFQQAYGGVPQQIQPMYTGYGGNFPQQSATSNFNTIANMRPPEPPQNPDKYAPSNIFAAMKTKNFGQSEESQPQAQAKYDALRPLTTGYNGAPQGMIPQQTGMAYPGMMMNQMTGFNPQQQGGYGWGYR